jgi:ribosomal protein S18 acetylase RimI-like enzyme
VEAKMPSVITIYKLELTYVEVDKGNVEQAIKVQNDIFPRPEEDATLNFLSSVDIKLFEDISKLKLICDKCVYYLVYNGKKPVAITGLYTLKNYSNDAWLGWFGVLPEERAKGYATRILQEMKRRVKEEWGKDYFRLHTDTGDNATACKLYEKLGFKYEKYTAEASDDDVTDNAIYSIATGNETKDLLWGNKLINIKHEEILLSDVEKHRIMGEYTKLGILKPQKE